MSINIFRAKGAATGPDVRMLAYVQSLAADTVNVRGWTLSREVNEPDAIVVTFLADCDEIDRIMSGLPHTSKDPGPGTYGLAVADGGTDPAEYDPRIGHVIPHSGRPCKCQYGDRGLVVIDSRCQAGRANDPAYQ